MSSQQDNDALEALGRKVKAARAAQAPEIEEDRSHWAVGIRYASEFTAAIVVGTLLGMGFDKLANTMPWGMIVGLGFGFVAAVRNIIRTAKELSVDADES